MGTRPRSVLLAGVRPPLLRPPAKRVLDALCVPLPSEAAAPKRTRVASPTRTAPWLSSRLSGAAAQARLNKPAEARAKALDVFGRLLFELGHKAGLYAKLSAGQEAFDHTSPSLQAVFATRKTGTLLKRAASLTQYRRYQASLGFDFLSFREEDVFSYMRCLAMNKAPPTRAQAAREALNLTAAMFEIADKSFGSSARIRGVAVRELERKQVTKQRAPLTVPMVSTLEDLFFRTDEGVKRILIGNLLFILFARARVGDMAKSDFEPVLDDSGGDTEGLVEGRMVNHKTAKPGARQALPVVAPAVGLTSRSWASSWLATRAAFSFDASKSGSLLVAPGLEESWSDAPLLTAEVGDMLREFLITAGFERGVVRHIGAHSLKATLLSWAAKFGVPRDVRRVLGYHCAVGDRATLAYSRDEVAVPVRELQKVLSAIRSHEFDPDASRSGRFRNMVPPAASSTSSSSSSAPEVISEDHAETDDEQPADDFPENVVINKYTRLIHLKVKDAEALVCGKRLPTKVGYLTEWPDNPRLCDTCFP